MDPVDSPEFSVLSWNLWWRYGPWEKRLPAIIETVRRARPDLIGLQEVWMADGTSSAQHIADELGYSCVTAASREADGVGFGNAVLSRWPIASSEVRDLPKHKDRPDDEGRLAIRADIDTPFGPLQLFCTHLNWRPDDSVVRQAQVADLCRFVRDSRPREHAAIVCGDFNAGPQSEEIRMMTGDTSVPVSGVVFTDTWADAGSEDGTTWSNCNEFVAANHTSDARIDYVFVGWRPGSPVGRPLRSQLVGDATVKGIWPSDHFGVLSVLRCA